MSAIRSNHRPVARQAVRPARISAGTAVQAMAIGGAFVLGIVIALSLPGVARAAEPPTAADDLFVAAHDGTLTVDAASGVLTNDGGTGLEAELWTEPTSGTVALNADGSLIYTRDTITRSDTFSYLATDVDGQSTEPAVVRVRFRERPARLPARPAPRPAPGSTIEADLGAVCTDTDGDPLTFSYQQPDVPGGSVWEADAQGHLVFVPPIDWTGTATVLFTAQDGIGSSLPAAFVVEVVPAD